MKLPLTVLLIVLTAIAVAALWPMEYARVKSPDGKYIAIAKYNAFRSWLQVFPGQSGDKKGWIAILTKEGKEVGSANLDMVGMIQDIRWSQGSAEVPLVATIKW